MTLETLISTMNREDDSFLVSMNLESDVVVGNQNGKEEKKFFYHSFGNVNFICSNLKGLSRNRNLTIENAQADICLLADDDLVYFDGYKDLILEWFNRLPNADVLIFNLVETPVTRYVIEKKFRVNHFNYMRFGSVRIAFKREPIIRSKIKFDEDVGAGASISFGEDTLFLHDCLKKKLKIYAVPAYILELKNDRPSTWFRGFTEKYFIDKGRLYYKISPLLSSLLCLQDILRHKKLYNIRLFDGYKLMLAGKNVEKKKLNFC